MGRRLADIGFRCVRVVGPLVLDADVADNRGGEMAMSAAYPATFSVV
jgi:hypothetical protein